ncbi:hypothetical protein [Sphingomonas hengshuiensis]|uniref:hypothetical protein n=1 Tax=Sphingomonas hengshuiensis TaxID=1609977 RepID=UPI0006979C24|nr:hypothetical protein [Sphingomonas hengshuiensis]
MLKQRPLSRLARLSERREYLTTRYDCAPTDSSALNRLAASLAEISEKVSTSVRAPKAGSA